MNQPNTQPAQWKLDLWELSERGDTATIRGTVTFSEGPELPLLLRMVWAGEQWRIDGFVFGIGSGERLDYLNVRCDE
ncbi:MAG: hypothetical protein JXA21_00520 [Anaerolineae bacterium]|nr:hypothetical protein [Anaerolineae bacterium]